MTRPQDTTISRLAAPPAQNLWASQGMHRPPARALVLEVERILTVFASAFPACGTGRDRTGRDRVRHQRMLEDRSASPTMQPDHDVVVETTTCYFCRRADLWLYFTCAVCQLTTHAKCYYRLGSDEANYYETNISDWRCQDCGGPQRHADCVLSGDDLVLHAGPRQSGGGHHHLGGEGGAAGDAAILDCPLIPHPPTTDDMLTDQNPSDKDMTRTTTKKQRTKTKKSGSLKHGGHSTQHLKNVHKAGRGSPKK